MGVLGGGGREEAAAGERGARVATSLGFIARPAGLGFRHPSGPTLRSQFCSPEAHKQLSSEAQDAASPQAAVWDRASEGLQSERSPSLDVALDRASEKQTERTSAGLSVSFLGRCIQAYSRKKTEPDGYEIAAQPQICRR